jgi:hypothetical protein
VRRWNAVVLFNIEEILWADRPPVFFDHLIRHATEGQVEGLPHGFDDLA